MGKSLSTSTCSILSPNPVVSYPLSHDRVFLLIIVCIIAVLLILCVTILRKWICKISSKGSNFKKKSKITNRLVPNRPQDNFNNVPQNSVVFLLHFLTNDEEENIRCQLLREWIKSFVEVVIFFFG